MAAKSKLVRIIFSSLVSNLQGIGPLKCFQEQLADLRYVVACPEKKAGDAEQQEAYGLQGM